MKEDWVRVFEVNGKQAVFMRFYDEGDDGENPYKIKLISMGKYGMSEATGGFPTEEERDASWIEAATQENAERGWKANNTMFD